MYLVGLPFRCIAAKGEGAPECDKFAKYYRSLCPGEWVCLFCIFQLQDEISMYVCVYIHILISIYIKCLYVCNAYALGCTLAVIPHSSKRRANMR